MAAPQRDPSLANDITIRGKPATQIEVAQFLEEVIKRRMSEALPPEDRRVLEDANRKLLVHASVGLWVGSTLGAAFVFRKRWAAGRSAVTGSSSVPRLFYPTRTGAAGAGAAEQTPRESRAKFIGKGIGFGMLGAFVGTQVGVWSGTRAAQTVIRESGHEERIAKSFKQAMDQAVAEIRNNSSGVKLDHKLLRATPTPSSPYGDSVDDFNDSHSRQDDPIIHDDAPEPSSSPSSQFNTSSISDDPPSRWDELRKQRPATASSWDSIREANTQSKLPPTNNRGDDQASVNADPRAGDKGAQRKEFEKLMERERRGGSEGGGDSSFDEGRWK